MKALAALADFLLPALCGVCQSPTSQNGALCAKCWGNLRFIARPYCECCGVPFALPTEEGTLCARCLTDPPPFTKARAALVYDDMGRKLVSQFKYGDKLHLLPGFAPWLKRAAADLLPEADVVMPVPLHWSRLWKRRFNQAALLAKQLGLPVDSQSLIRRRRTRRQVGMTREQRLQNVKDAFAVRGSVAGKTVLLVDDVHTTGATLAACTRALMAAGAKEVRVLTLAMVVVPGQIDG